MLMQATPLPSGLGSFVSGQCTVQLGVQLPGIVFSFLGAAGFGLASVAVKYNLQWLYFLGLGPCVGSCAGISFDIGLQVCASVSLKSMCGCGWVGGWACACGWSMRSAHGLVLGRMLT